ncbi:MAG: DUF2202 domain-containing protein [Robiginitalea sp.]|nr:DUF2202 domain-containing protein [Robiginitalea sp.]
MKRISYYRHVTLLSWLLAFSFFTTSCESDSGATVYESDATQTDDTTPSDTPDSDDSDSADSDSDSDDLSTEDQQALYFMLEEEKLARDVYSYLGDLWEIPVFENIMQSEIQHVAAVETLLVAYGLEYELLDPGTFNDQELQTLYDELTTAGTEDLEAALWVGASIEDLDIRDLQAFIDATDTEAIQSVFESLQCGSRNHLRAFNAALENLGTAYIPQFISVELFEAIITSNREQCN